MANTSNPMIVPLFLRVTGGSPSLGDEDALPTVVEATSDGLVLARASKITEVKTETTDDN
jgi:hypothetical protein